MVCVDVAILVPRGRRLGVLCARSGTRIELPWASPGPGESLLDAATRAALSATGNAPTWIEQTGASSETSRDPVPALSIGYVATQSEVSRAGLDWVDLRAAAAGIAGRQRWLLDAAVRQVRNRMDQQPIAFRMLPPRFSLVELQVVYEILLGRRLHKASFRRALNSARLVAPTGEWLANRRGRPAQLYRFAPRRRGTRLRPVRFDLI